MDLVTGVDCEITRQRTVSRQQPCATTVDFGDRWQGRALKREKGSKERERTQGRSQRKVEKKMGKGLVVE